jgi:dipeptidase E
MSVDLHLLSKPGDQDIRYILDACRPYLEAQTRPLLAFMQWASFEHDWLAYTQKEFHGLAEVADLRWQLESLPENERILEQCGVVFISGGNTPLLNHRLHEGGLLEPLRGHARIGLPIVGFSAGALLCGPNILTPHDINMLPTCHFDSLNLLPYNIVAHYPDHVAGQDAEDDWLSDYHAAHANPILALEDDAYVRSDGHTLRRLRGSAWILERGKARTPLD